MKLTRQLMAFVSALLLGLGAAFVLAGDGEIPVTTSSDKARMHFIAGQAALDRGDAAHANALFRAAVEADPNFVYAWYNLGNAAFSTAEFAEAQQRAAAVDADVSPGERMLVEINQRFLDNDFAAQLALSRKLVKEYPDSARAWLNLGLVEQGQNQFDASRTSMRNAIERAPRLAAGYLALANSYLFNDPKNFKKSETLFKEAIHLEPGVANHYWGLGDVYRADQQLEKARDYYALATTLDPHNGTAFVKKGHVESFLGNYDAARADYDRGIEVARPANKPFLANYRAFTWVHEGEQVARAVQELRNIAASVDALDVAPKQRSGAKIFSLTNAAAICLHKGMYDDADAVLRDRAKLLRASAEAVGTDEFMHIQEANIAYYEGQLAARRGEYRKAMKLAKKNAELVDEQDNPRKMENYHDLMGLIHLAQGEFDKAVENYRKANLNSMYTKYHLALALDGAGDGGQARDLFKEVGQWNFNSVGYALVRQDALARAS